MAIGITYYGGKPKGSTIGPPSPYLNPDGTVKGSSIGPTLPVGPTAPSSAVPVFDFSGIGGIDLGTSSTGSSSLSGQAALQNATLNQTKYNAEIEAARVARENAAKGAAYQLSYLQNQMAGAGQIPASLLEQFAKQQSTGEGYINQQYQSLLDQLNARKGLAEQNTTTGYNALQNYLQQNQPTAYAQAANATPQVIQNALAQYMQSQCVNPATAQPAVDMANAAAVGGATNYNELLNVLRAREQSGQQSRLAEEQMARQFGLQNIQQLYGAGTSGLESGKLSALADLSSRVQAAKLQAEQQRIAREQALSDAMASIYGTGYVPYTPPVEGATPPGTPPVTPTTQVAPAAPTQSAPVAKLAAQVANAKNQTLVNRANTFIENNPTATAAQIAKAFPSLSKKK